MPTVLQPWARVEADAGADAGEALALDRRRLGPGLLQTHELGATPAWYSERRLSRVHTDKLAEGDPEVCRLLSKKCIAPIRG